MLSVLHGDTAHSLDDGSICRLIDFDGWGMSPLERYSEKGAAQHGDTDEGFQLEPRFGTLTFILEEITLEGMYNQREKLINLFRPDLEPKLRWELPNGVTKQIDVVYAEDMTLPWKAKSWAAQKIIVTLKANNPWFYDPIGTGISFGISGGGTPWDIPWNIPWNIGSSVLDQIISHNYLGNFLAEPILTVTGPIENPKIENLSTGDKLDFPGLILAGSEYIIIDARFNKKTVKNHLGADLQNILSDDSDLATFYVWPGANPFQPGVNDFRVTGSGANQLTQVYMNYNTRFLGL